MGLWEQVFDAVVLGGTAHELSRTDETRHPKEWKKPVSVLVFDMIY